MPQVQDGQSSRLCSNCQRIDWKQLLPNAYLDIPEGITGPDGSVWKSGMYFRHPDGRIEPRPYSWPSLPKWDLGLLCDIISRTKSCTLCTLIVKTLKTHQGVEQLETEMNGYSLSCRVYSEKIGDVQPDDGVYPFKVAVTGWHISKLRFSCWTKIPGASNYAGFGAAYAAQIGPPSTVRTQSSGNGRSVPRPPTYLGRYRPVQCDIALFDRWISNCTKGHVDCQRSSPGKMNTSIRLVDVNENCLKTFKVEDISSIQYLALSYVWGNSEKDFVLTKSNLTKYHQFNSLGRLPRTIDNAMSLVCKLGRKYLWVDALCIIQDSPEDHEVQIPAMKYIYGNALLTIIAGFGDDADAGLPGINTNRADSMVVDIGGITVIESTTTFSPFNGSPVTQTTWNTRGWTFQEYLLSLRCIIFLRGQAYWRCRTAEWFEDMDFDDTNIRFIWGNNNMEGNTELTVKNYGKLIEHYTKRKLTFDKDIYNAFSGILEVIPDKFYCAIPYSMFREYLCWTKSWDSKGQEGNPSELHWHGLNGAPTWSWMAWKGAISMRYDGHYPTALISCYRFHNGSLVQMSTPNATSFPLGNPEMENVSYRSVWNGTEEYVCSMEDIPLGFTLLDTHVIFKTLVAEMSIKDAESLTEYPSLIPKVEVDKKTRRSYALISTHGWGGLHMLELSEDSGISRRERLISWRGADWLFACAKKRQSF